MADIIQVRRDTSANWTTANPILANGEPGFETDSFRIKYGDGATEWNLLGYQTADIGSVDWGNIVGSLASQVDLQNELDLKANLAYVDSGLALKANQTSLDNTDIIVGDNQTAININKADIATNASDITSLETLKADQTSLDTTNTNVSTNASDITNLQTGKEDDLGNPSTDDYILASTTLGARYWKVDEGGVTTSWGGITGTLSDQTDLQNEFDTTNTNVSTNTSNIAGKANQTSLDTTNSNVSTNTSNIATNTSAISSKAEQSSLDTTNSNVSTNTANIDLKANRNLIVNNQGLDAYTLKLTDLNNYVRVTNANSNTLTVPNNTSVAFSIGAQVHIRQSNIGLTTIVADSGVVIKTPQTLMLGGINSTVTIVKVATNEWDIFGDLQIL